MNCNNCGSENVLNAVFCQSCGAEMPSNSSDFSLELDFSNVDSSSEQEGSKLSKDQEETTKLAEPTLDLNKIYTNPNVRNKRNQSATVNSGYQANKVIGMYTNPNANINLSLGEIHPWKRFFAKTIDRFLIFFILIAIFMVYIFSSDNPEEQVAFLTSTFDNRFLNILILLIPTIFIEAIMLSLSGSTLGKWLLGMKVVNNDGSKLDFLTSLNRNFLVFIKGEGLWLGIIPLITYIYSYYSLQNHKISSWDSGLGIRLIHVPVGIIRAVIILLLSLLGLYFIFSSILTIFFSILFCI